MRRLPELPVTTARGYARVRGPGCRGDRQATDVTLVAQSMGAFTAALVCARVRRNYEARLRQRDDPASWRNGRRVGGSNTESEKARRQRPDVVATPPSSKSTRTFCTTYRSPSCEVLADARARRGRHRVPRARDLRGMARRSDSRRGRQRRSVLPRAFQARVARERLGVRRRSPGRPLGRRSRIRASSPNACSVTCRK